MRVDDYNSGSESGLDTQKERMSKVLLDFG